MTTTKTITVTVTAEDGEIEAVLTDIRGLIWEGTEHAPYEADIEVETQPTPTSDQVFLVAFQICQATGRAEGYKVLDDILSGVNDRLEAHAEADREDGTFHEICWWVAEDDRDDGSDNDSAVFVHPGAQQEAAEALHSLGLTGRCNLVTPVVNDHFGGADEPIGCGPGRADATHRLVRLAEVQGLVEQGRKALHSDNGRDQYFDALDALVTALDR
jgi:hypothetical protein